MKMKPDLGTCVNKSATIILKLTFDGTPILTLDGTHILL